MTSEEAYEEAQRRLRLAEQTGALELDLSGLILNDFLGSWAASQPLLSPRRPYGVAESSNVRPKMPREGALVQDPHETVSEIKWLGRVCPSRSRSGG
jgi:hypothetical protein